MVKLYNCHGLLSVIIIVIIIICLVSLFLSFKQTNFKKKPKFFFLNKQTNIDCTIENAVTVFVGYYLPNSSYFSLLSLIGNPPCSESIVSFNFFLTQSKILKNFKNFKCSTIFLASSERVAAILEALRTVNDDLYVRCEFLLSRQSDRNGELDVDISLDVVVYRRSRCATEFLVACVCR